MVKLWECRNIMSYEADNPVDSAKQFIGNIPISEWYISVKNIETGEYFDVDMETWEIE